MLLSLLVPPSKTSRRRWCPASKQSYTKFWTEIHSINCIYLCKFSWNSTCQSLLLVEKVRTAVAPSLDLEFYIAGWVFFPIVLFYLNFRAPFGPSTCSLSPRKASAEFTFINPTVIPVTHNGNWSTGTSGSCCRK